VSDGGVQATDPPTPIWACCRRPVDVSRRARTVDPVDERDEEPRPGEPRRGEWFIWRLPRRVRVLSAAAHRARRRVPAAPTRTGPLGRASRSRGSV